MPNIKNIETVSFAKIVHNKHAGMEQICSSVQSDI